MINKKIHIGLDVDDVLFPCVPLAVDLANKELNPDPLITVEDITTWGPETKETKMIYPYLFDQRVYDAQLPMPGAVEFVQKLSKMAELFIVTAIVPELSEFRVNQIKRFFPSINPMNIIPSYRKDLLTLDFVLDDGSHNILQSQATYPVLMRRPWNHDMSGMLVVNGYDEFINLVNFIVNQNSTFSRNEFGGNIICMVGPSASGKSSIAKAFVNNGKAVQTRPATTRPRRPQEPENAYTFMSLEQFEEYDKKNMFAEKSVYAGNHYGSLKSDIAANIGEGKDVIIPIDISGAINLKRTFSNVVIVYVHRKKGDIIKSLLERYSSGNSSIDDIKNRILSLDQESRNRALCDIVVNNDSTPENAMKEIIHDIYN